jgi:hypothetical protein
LVASSSLSVTSTFNFQVQTAQKSGSVHRCHAQETAAGLRWCCYEPNNCVNAIVVAHCKYPHRRVTTPLSFIFSPLAAVREPAPGLVLSLRTKRWKLNNNQEGCKHEEENIRFRLPLAELSFSLKVPATGGLDCYSDDHSR